MTTTTKPRPSSTETSRVQQRDETADIDKAVEDTQNAEPKSPLKQR